jgi:hypothetical protein
MSDKVTTAKYDPEKIGELDENGLIIYEPKDLSEHMEWISLTQRQLKLDNSGLKLLFELMDRGATKEQAVKTIKQIKEMALEPVDGLNEIVKVSGVDPEKTEEKDGE